MKLSISFLLSAFLCCGLVGCGSKGSLVLPEQKPAQDSASAQKPAK